MSIDSIKLTFSRVGTTGNILIILAVLILFIIAAVYTYKQYIGPRLNKKYVANKEYVKAGDDTGSVDLYYFYTVWCPHCKTATPIWNSFKKEIGDKQIKGMTVNFIEVDCDKDADLASKFNVKGYPTIKMVKGNQVIEYDAKPNKDTLMEFLQTSI